MPRTATARSKNGCSTCRQRKVKCDEARPVCNHCARAGRPCTYVAATPLRERRAGAGPLKDRERTGWRPPPIAAAGLEAAGGSDPTATLGAQAEASMTVAPEVTGYPMMLPMRPLPALSTSMPAYSAPEATLPTLSTSMPPYSAPEATLPVSTSMPPYSAPSTLPVSTSMPLYSLPETFPDFAASTTLSQFPQLPSTAYAPSFDLVPGPTEYDMYAGALAYAYPAQLPVAASTSLGPELGYVTDTYGYDGRPVAGASTNVHPPFGHVPLLYTPRTGPVFWNSLVQLNEGDHRALALFNARAGADADAQLPFASTHACLMGLAVHHAGVLHFLLASCFTDQYWHSLHTAAGGDTALWTSARGHYLAGTHAMGGEMGNAAVVLASFWFEYLIQRRRTGIPGYRATYGPPSDPARAAVREVQCRRWESGADFSAAMGRFVAAEQLGLRAGGVHRMLAWLYWQDCRAAFFGNGGQLAAALRPQLADYAGAGEGVQAPPMLLVHASFVLVHRLNDATEGKPRMAELRDIAAAINALPHTHAPIYALSASTSRVRSPVTVVADIAVIHCLALALYASRAGAPVDARGHEARIVRLTETAVAAAGVAVIDRLQWVLFWVGIAPDAPSRAYAQAQLTNAEVRRAVDAVNMAEATGVRLSVQQLRRVAADAARADVD